jgi:hypothetical protein
MAPYDVASTIHQSLYPGAPYERKYMALDLLNAVAETWGVGVEGYELPPSAHAVATATATPATTNNIEIDAASEAAAAEMEASPYAPCLGANCTTSLLGAAVDSWQGRPLLSLT